MCVCMCVCVCVCLAGGMRVWWISTSIVVPGALSAISATAILVLRVQDYVLLKLN